MLSKAELVPGGSSISELCSWLYFSFLKVADKEETTLYIQILLHLALSSVTCQALLEGHVPLCSGSGLLSPLINLFFWRQIKKVTTMQHCHVPSCCQRGSEAAD